MHTNLSKSILRAKIPKASGKAVNKCPALGYSTPGAVSSKSAQVTLCGSQNLSFQNQAENAAMFLLFPTAQMLNYWVYSRLFLRSDLWDDLPDLTLARPREQQQRRFRSRLSKYMSQRMFKCFVWALLASAIFKIRPANTP